jgi:hypothetical protein
MTQSEGAPAIAFDWKRWLFIGIGLTLFFVVYYSPPWPDAIDPNGKHFVLSQQAKGPWRSFCWPGPSGCSRCCPSASPAF